MATRPSRGIAAEVPDLLTVEEAAAVLRIGRTKAYAMTQEWRASGGRSGLPVVDFGSVLRVPRRALEELIGAELTGTVAVEDGSGTTSGDPPNTRPEPATANDGSPAPLSTKRRSRRRRTHARNQLEFFQAPPPPES